MGLFNNTNFICHTNNLKSVIIKYHNLIVFNFTVLLINNRSGRLRILNE
jgi:hypothetical protein